MILTITGEINEEGKLHLFNQNTLTDFKTKNKGKKIIVTFESEDSQSLEVMRKYYYAKVIPEWKQALLARGEMKSTKEIDYYLRSLSPILKRKTLSELTKEEFYFFMDHVKDVSLQDVNLFVENMRCL